MAPPVAPLGAVQRQLTLSSKMAKKQQRGKQSRTKSLKSKAGHARAALAKKRKLDKESIEEMSREAFDLLMQEFRADSCDDSSDDSCDESGDDSSDDCVEFLVPNGVLIGSAPTHSVLDLKWDDTAEWWL